MNREILFRAKRVDNGEWVDGNYNLLEIGSNPIPIIIPFQKLARARMSDAFMYQIDLSTRGQYTGLTDKNGRRIFEGDIVKYKDKIYEIRYFIPQARFLAILPNGMFNPAVFLNCEVIGNIHDNPELMGGENNV